MARQEYVEPTAIESLKDLLEEGDATKLDYTEDAWSYGAPPPWDYYKLKLFLDKEGIKYGFEDDKNKKGLYIQFKLIGKITEGDYADIPVYFNVSTRVNRGKSISTMAGLITKLLKDPSKLPNPVTPKALAQLLEKILPQEPVVMAEVDWKGAYSYTDTKTNKDQWKNTHRSWKDFPNDPENVGEKLYEVSVGIPKELGGGVAEVRAMTQVVRFFSAKEEKPVIDRKAEWEKKAKAGSNGQPTLQKVNTAVVPDLVLETATPAASAPTLHRANSVSAPVAGDLDLVLDS